MSRQKKIIVACASGVATSQTIASKIQSMLDNEKINAKVEATNLSSLSSVIDSADAYISIVPHSGENWDVPTFSGIPYLTGQNLNEEFKQLKSALQN